MWQPPPKSQPSADNSELDASVSTEWDDILAQASEAEIVELAAILGFTGLVNQVQFHTALKKTQLADGADEASAVDDDGEAASTGGWNAAAKAESLKFVPPEPDNQTDVDESIRRLNENDESLATLNLNNIKVCILGKPMNFDFFIFLDLSPKYVCAYVEYFVREDESDHRGREEQHSLEDTHHVERRHARLGG